MIIVHKSKDGQFYFTVTAHNNKVLTTSETYKKKAGAIKGITSLINLITDGDYSIIDKTKKC